jgi:hypothetical protein
MPDQRRDALYQREAQVLSEVIERTFGRDWNPVDGAPYGGLYFLRKMDERTRFDLGVREICKALALTCSFCGLLARAARTANATLPVITGVEC